ncbi:phage tail terminator-like protein [uncultured Halomonas sp.]|uniref:phage tail terminator-like protein n=1 Tax=uncultured Halomonas sp. TaxID=173971 RepID=UPI00262A4F5C|nr:phage tail terminator-like protein [uncultured Halomonas sp.]
MTFDQIRLAVESRMVEWDGVPVAYDNVPTPPSVQAAMDAKSPWVRLTINHGASNIAALGSDPETRRTGLIQCQVFTNVRIGSKPAADTADSLATHLQYQRLGRVETLAASVQRIGPSDGWFQYNLSIPFRAD